MPLMLIEFDFKDDICILRLKGRFVTGGDAQYLRSKIDELKSTGCQKVVADFKNVPYLDSTGIGFVVGAYTTFANAKGQFVLANVNPHVHEVLRIMKLVEIIPIYESKESAMRALEKTTAKSSKRAQG